ncbi:MAG: rRNA methyltransferase [Spirochaetales bacterium]|nr:MAG: rRNA methyltransferase [Spirochaetales bacterium]
MTKRRKYIPLFSPFRGSKGSPLDPYCAPGYAQKVLTEKDIQLQNYLEGFLTAERKARLQTVLAQRTRYLCCVLEDLYDPRNGSAVLRHCDALGIQEVHAIQNRNLFRSDENVDMGTAQWLDVNVYKRREDVPLSVKSRRRAVKTLTSAEKPTSTPQVLSALKERGFRIAATSPHGENEAVPETLDLAAGPVAVVFGTEKHGISKQVRDAADVFITIPMVGFVESFNISASAAIVLHVLSRRLRNENLPWRLDPADAREIYFRWVKTAVPHSKALIKHFEADTAGSLQQPPAIL